MSVLTNPSTLKCIVHLLVKRHGPATITQEDFDSIAGEILMERYDGESVTLHAHNPQEPIPAHDKFFPATTRKGHPQ